MAVNGLRGAGHNVRAVQAAYSVAEVRPATEQSADVRGELGTRATSVRISEGAELLGKLQRLHDTQPKQFKQLMRELASEAHERAAQQQGKSAERLTHLAERLSEAAKEGNLQPAVPELHAARTAITYYQRELDAFVAPTDAARALFRGFVDKVNGALAAAPTSGDLRTRAWRVSDESTPATQRAAEAPLPTYTARGRLIASL